MTEPVSRPTDTTPKIKTTSLLNLWRVLWVILFITSMTAFVLAIPVIWEQAHTANTVIAAGLTQLGLPPNLFAIYTFVVQIATALIFQLVGVFIFMKVSNERMGLLAAMFLVTFGTELGISLGEPPSVSLPLGGLLLPTITYVVGWISVWLFAIMFPDGRFAIRGSWLVSVIGIVTIPFWMLPPNSPLYTHNWSPLLQGLLVIATFGATVYIQYYRYRYISTPIQRQQSKWLILNLGIITVLIFIAMMLPALVPSVTKPGVPALINGVIQTLPTLTSITTPIILMIAIIRYRLWDIDLLINRSLVYGAVTVLLLIVFGLGTLIIGSIVGQVASGVAFPVSAVAVGLLFNPARKGMQSFIDHRVYRFNYDLNELSAAQKKPDIKNPGILTGRKLGEYEVLGVLGKGGMGEVYKGYHAGQTVALKILSADLSKQPAFISRFEREAKAMQRLNHPHIVKLLSVGGDDSLRYMALEFIDGIDLSNYLKQHNHLSLMDVQLLLQPLSQALDYAHSLGIIHRDIKPSNVMLREGKVAQAVLMDFGLAKLHDSQTRLTESGAIGTIDYMAPEQIMAAREVDHRTDIYSLGAMVYQMLTGEPPFSGNVGQVVFAHLQQPIPDPCDLNPDLPREVGKIIRKALAKQPDERFDSAGVFASTLSQAATVAVI